MILRLSNASSGELITIDNLPAVVGRDKGTEVRLADPLIAPYQCMIAKNGSDTLTVWNLREEIPVRVNDRETLKAPLLPGDRLTMGNTEFVIDYRLPGQSQTAAGFTPRSNTAEDAPRPVALS
jgi:pSer/pThr/pTyr-binding forkhead associated (FHA) protein